MFSSLFEKFRKTKANHLKAQEDLDAEWDKIKQQYATIGYSELYQLMIEYFLTKMELNRDSLEKFNPYSEADRAKILDLQAQNKVMSQFILDMEGMKEQLKQVNNPEI